jgi:CheY-like chemotaxis protein
MARRILIADDSVTIQKAFAMTFAGEDVSVTAARSADEGWALAQKNHPDIIVADGTMPGRTGYDLCAQVRADAGLREVPVYVLASAQQPYDEPRGQRAGVDGHLMKPWDTTTLVRDIGDALRRGPSGVTAHGASAPAPSQPAASLPARGLDDEYGEISIDRGRENEPTPPPIAPSQPLAPPRMPIGAPATAAAAPPGLRPSLIPGLRPGITSPARPGTAPNRPLAASGMMPPPAPPRPAMPMAGRTMIGLPAANIPIPGAMRPVAPAANAPARPRVVTPPPPSSSPASAAFRPRVATPPPPAAAPAPPVSPPSSPAIAMPTTAHAPATSLSQAPVAAPSAVQATVSASVNQKLAAIAAKGPEYEAIAKLSREIIEQVVWEVVPELAEAIIREHVAKRGV